jgi:ABC-type Na+ efflux pump permease subunit
MSLHALVALVRKDLALFFRDRRAVVMSLVAPIVIASFFGFLFSGSSDKGESARIPIRVVDRDGSALSRAVLDGLAREPSLEVAHGTAEEAREAVRKGKTAVAVILPPGFGAAAGRAFFNAGDKPEITLLHDPSRIGELAMVRGVLTQHVMEAVSKETFTGAGGLETIDEALRGVAGDKEMDQETRGSLRGLLENARRLNLDAQRSGGQAPAGLAMPYGVREEAVTARRGVAYNSFAHAFAGMGVQFVLLAAIDLGTGILLERQRGLWKRLRSAPLSRSLLLGAKAVSGALLGLLTLLAAFGFAMLVFGVRIQGSLLGFLGVAAACALMASTLGLLIAALGQTPQATRGIATLIILVMVMLGGAWVPAFIFPAWLQKVTLAVPARWAIDGLDATTWRGVDLAGAALPIAVLLGFALAFGLLAVARFRWEED